MHDKTFYVSLDVHKLTTTICVLNGFGKQIMHQVVETKAGTLISAITALSGTIHLTFEEGIHACWLYDLLLPHVSTLLVCNPNEVRSHHSGNKNDKLDAFRLAQLLRTGSLKGVYHGEHGLRALKELAHSYQCLVADCTRTRNRIKAIFRGRAIACDGEAVFHPDKRQLWLAQLSEIGVRTRASHLYVELDCLTKLRAEAEALMIAEARKQQAFHLLDSIPTIGPVRAALLIAAIVTPHRFRTKRQLWTYSGFSVVARTSSDFLIQQGKIVRVQHKAATRGLNNNHNHTLKLVFKSAANSVRSGAFKLYYDRLRSQGMRDEMARLTLARKIAAITLAVWRKGVKFDPAFLQTND